MSNSTAKIARKTITLPTILYNAYISDVVVLEQVFDKVSNEPSLVRGKPLMTAKSILGVEFETLKVDQI